MSAHGPMCNCDSCFNAPAYQSAAAPQFLRDEKVQRLESFARDIEAMRKIGYQSASMTQLGVGHHAYRLAMDRLAEAQHLFEAAAGLERANLR